MTPVRILAVAVAAALLTSCGGVTTEPPSSPTPTAAEKPDDRLVLSLDGLGPLKYGMPDRKVAATGLVRRAACGEPFGPDAWYWKPASAYRKAGGMGAHAFEVSSFDGNLRAIDVWSSSIPTDQGVRLGDTVAELKNAYGPDLREHPLGYPTANGRVYTVEGEKSALVFDVVVGDPKTFGPVGTIWSIRLQDRSSQYDSIANTDGGAGGCL
jgi:hypothetical protein